MAPPENQAFIEKIIATNLDRASRVCSRADSFMVLRSVRAFVCAFVSAFVCSFRGLFACVLSWVEICVRYPSFTARRFVVAKLRHNVQSRDA